MGAWMLTFQMLFLLSRCPGAVSHGYLSKPSSRNVNNCGDGGGTFCISDVSTGQGFTGAAPPGSTSVPEPACGAGRDDARYTTKGNIMATYTAGQTINVEYKLNANHGGHVAYRLCLDGSDTENCFRERYLESEGGEIWMKVPDNAGGAYSPSPVTVKNTIRIPDGVSCEKCTLSWRWDSDHGDVSKVRVNCADISIVGNSDEGGPIDTGDAIDAGGDIDAGGSDSADGVGFVSVANRKATLWSSILAAAAVLFSLGMTKGSRS